MSDVLAPSPLRRALFRGLLLGAALSGVALLAFLVAWTQSPVLSGQGATIALGIVCVGLCFGLVATPVSLIEFHVAQGELSRDRLIRAGALVWLAATIALFLAFLQANYTFSVLNRGDLGAGASGLQTMLSEMRHDPGPLIGFPLLALPLALAVPARLAGLSRWRQTGLLVSGSLLAMLPLGLLAGLDGETWLLSGAVAAGWGGSVPWVFGCADWVEARFFAEPEEPTPR